MIKSILLIVGIGIIKVFNTNLSALEMTFNFLKLYRLTVNQWLKDLGAI